MKHVGTRQRIKKKEGRIEMEKIRKYWGNKEGKGGRIRKKSENWKGLIIK
jgi:hypothetical protein